uniref:Cathepsin L-like n=1 Tax=Parastrongyloides trichosuri TaxID=131310 RepID=A0A0N5A141_PARTI
MKYVNNTQYYKLINDWKKFKKQFGKKYKNKTEEALHRMEFLNTKDLINKHNEMYKKGKSAFEMKINEISDFTLSKYNYRRGLKFNRTRFIINQDEDSRLLKNNVTIPESIDWRKYNRVSPVQNQLDCGACWIFSGNGAMEAAYAKKSGKLYSFSVQQVADCYGGKACNGGWMTTAFQYGKLRGLEVTEDYPYVAKVRTCKYNQSKVVGRIKKWINLKKDENNLKRVVGTIGPVSVGIDASLSTFQNYKNGIYDDPKCTTNIDHAVLIIGYDTDPVFGDYWIVKNSWGTTWGINGYFKIKRGVNQCGIAEAPTYPIA